MSSPLILQCPTCSATLLDGKHDPILCERCGDSFPIHDGVPQLLSRDNPLFVPAAAATPAERTARTGSGHRPAWMKRLATWLPQPSDASGPDLFAIARLHGVGTFPTRALIVGAGDGAAALAAQLHSHFDEVVVTDVVWSLGVDDVCDAHALPFADDSFDAVTLLAVLEHVLDPVAVVAEVVRVLAPGGVVIAETPFVQQVHMGAYDFTRFTELGHRWLFRCFAEVARGHRHGPGTALAWSLIYLLVGFADSPGTTSIAKATGRVAFSMVARADRFMAGKRGASDGAATTYFVGTNRKTPCISARELIDSYRGAVR